MEVSNTAETIKPKLERIKEVIDPVVKNDEVVNDLQRTKIIDKGVNVVEHINKIAVDVLTTVFDKSKVFHAIRINEEV